MNISESLRAGDLRYVVKNIFEIDSFKSKIGNDQDVVVLSFTVTDEDPAKDLVNFIEMGYNFVIDADVSPGETDDNVYKVFVEIERSRHIATQIKSILNGVEKITNIKDFRFRYFKSFKSQAATEENLSAAIPTDKNSYDQTTAENMLENFSNFFANSYVEELKVLDESISFKRIWKDPVKFNIVTSGPRSAVYNSIKGPIMIESKDIAEVMFFTKYIGNYNITKVGDVFIFENNNWAVALDKKL